MQIHETIKLRRKELDLTQEQMANYLGVTPPAVHKWEKGTSYPDITLLPALARLLEVDLNTLFSFEKELSEVEITNYEEKVENLYERAVLYGDEKGQEQKKSGFMEHMANTLAESLKTEAGVDGRGFLQGDAELEELLNKYVEA